MKLTFSDEEVETVREAAARDHVTPARFAAEATLAAARGEILRPDRPLRDALVEHMQARAQVRKIGVNLNQAVAALNATGEDPGNLLPYAEACMRAIRRLEEASVAIRRRIP
ncbi:MAG: hypothetical protein ACRDPT_05585 [Streptomycetales bacterium]